MKVVELFSGIGAQAQGLKDAGIPYESVVCEIDDKAYKAYCAIHGDTPNLGDITKVEHLPECDLLFYSWPCQSCSIAGSQTGMVEGSGTESSLLWEVVRLLRDAEKRGALPEYLGAENVPAVTNKRNKPELDRMIGILEDMGYTVSWSIMNAKDYGVPQNRKRFFMVASLHHGRFVFPEPCPDGRVLKDVLEPPEDVPKKCWLSKERIAKYEEHYRRCQEKGNGFGWNPTDGAGIGHAVTTSADRQYSNMLIQCGDLNLPGHESSSRVYDPEGISPTVTTPAGGGHMPRIRWPNGDSAGYREAEDGDGLVMARPTLARGTVQKQMSPTVTCGQTSGVCVDVSEELPFMAEGDVCPMLTPKRACKRQNDRRFKKPGEPSFTVTTQDRHGIAEAMEGRLRIRYLTPLECWRLQGFSDEAFYKAKAVPTSDTQLYKQAGNSIAVPCLTAIFKQMFKYEKDRYTPGWGIPAYETHMIGRVPWRVVPRRERRYGRRCSICA